MTVISGATNLKTAQGEYDFAVDGGAISTHPRRLHRGGTLPNLIPSGSIILGGYIEVDTLVTSASGNTGTISVNAEGAADLQAAVAVSGAPWSTTGRKSITPAFTGAASVKTTTNRSLAITVAVAALTAGKFRVVVYYR
jgi:hypothetical protein